MKRLTVLWFLFSVISITSLSFPSIASAKCACYESTVDPTLGVPVCGYLSGCTTAETYENTHCDFGECECICKSKPEVSPSLCPPDPGIVLKCCVPESSVYWECENPSSDKKCPAGYNLKCCVWTLAGYTCTDTGEYCPSGYDLDDTVDPHVCRPTAPVTVKRDPCYDYREDIPDDKRVNQECADCLGRSLGKGPNEEDLSRPNIGKKAWTALGCIPFQPEELMRILLRIAFGIGGGVAFLFMAMGAFKVLTCQGNPEVLNEGKSMITSSIAGLLLIIFSIFILKIIGYDILGLPEFAKCPLENCVEVAVENCPAGCYQTPGEHNLVKCCPTTCFLAECQPMKSKDCPTACKSTPLGPEEPDWVNCCPP